MNWTPVSRTRHIPRRSKLETCLDVLEAVGSGAERMTHVMYRANVCWVALKHYLGELTAQRLVEEINLDGRKKYIITKKGTLTLESYRRVRNQLPAMPEIKQ